MNECKKYNECGERVAHAGGNGDERGSGDSPPAKTWANKCRLFMKIMKDMKKNMAKLAKKVSHHKDDRKKLRKRSCYESESSNSNTTRGNMMNSWIMQT